MAQLFAVDAHVHGDLTRIVVTGEVDISVAHAFTDEVRAIVETSLGPIELDFGGLTYADSSALQAIVGLVLEAHERALGARIVAVSRPVRRVMEAAGLTELLGLDGDSR